MTGGPDASLPGGVDLIVEDDGWTAAIPAPDALAAACYDAASRFEPALGGAGLSLLLTSDAALRDLNVRFRGKDAPTNVLAFPAHVSPDWPPDWPTERRAAEPAPRFLGDVALARETCLREARGRGVAVADHAAHLIVHGVLHLIGYDHQDEDEAVRMENRETAILAALGVADPYDAADHDETGPCPDEPYGDEVETL